MTNLLQQKKTHTVLIFLMILFSALLMSHWSTNDLYFMFNHGRYILEHGFPTTEPFTIHEGFSFSIQKWATCVVYWLLWTSTGWVGLVLLTIVLAILRNFLCFYLLKPIVKDNAKCAVLILLYSALMHPFTLSRPQQFSDVILLLEIILLEKYAGSGKWKYLCWLPVLSLVEMQFHSTTWPLFFIVMIPYLLEHKFKFEIYGIRTDADYRKLPLILSGILSLLAGLINPYGIQTFFYIINEFRGNDSANDLVSELQPFVPAENWAIMAVIVACFVLWKFTSVRQRYALLFLGTGFMTLTHIRSLETFAPFLTICLGDMLSQMDDQFAKISGSKWIRMLLYTVFTICAGGFCLFVCINDTISGNYLNSNYGSRAIDWLVDDYGIDLEQDAVFTNYNNGSYAEYRGIRTYIDSRSEVFQDSVNKKENIMDEFHDFLYGTITHSELQEKYGFAYWILDNKLIINSLMEDPDYKVIYSDPTGWDIFEYIGDSSSNEEE